MINLNRQGGQGRFLFKRLLKDRVVVVATVALFLGIFAPAGLRAEPINQLEYLQWLVQLSGDSDRFSKSSAASDYVTWARERGMQLKDGWNLNGKLTREALAQTLVQFLQLNPGKQSDYQEILARHGISLPSASEISRKDMTSLVDSGMQPEHALFRRPRSPHKPDKDKDKDKDRDRDKDRDKDKDKDKDKDRDNDRGGPFDEDKDKDKDD